MWISRKLAVGVTALVAFSAAAGAVVTSLVSGDEANAKTAVRALAGVRPDALSCTLHRPDALDHARNEATAYLYPEFSGGLGGYARFVAICPPGTAKGDRISKNDAPLAKSASPLHWDTDLGYRVR